MLCPAPLEPGSGVWVVAPSSPFDRTLVRRGMAWLGTRYRVKFEPGLFDRQGFLAGDDARRSHELHRALRDPETRAIVAARGGYGLGRITPSLDLGVLKTHPKWIVGFSDLTALHLEAAHAGVMTLHAHNVAGLGRGDARAREEWVNALESTGSGEFRQLDVYHPGEASGPLFGGNLTVLFCAHAAGRLRPPAGAILLLEDVTETSYRIDRMLTSLVQSGVLRDVAGVVLGQFTDCSAGKYQVPTDIVLRERLGQLGVPVLAGLPVGHGRNNVPVRLGAIAHLSAACAMLSIESSAQHRGWSPR